MIDTGNKQFRLLSIDDLERAILVQSSAFNNDPFWQYLIPNPEKRTKMLPQFFSVFLKVNIHNGTAYGISTPIEGVAVWSAPNQKSIDLSGFIGSDLVKLSLGGFLFPFLKATQEFACTGKNGLAADFQVTNTFPRNKWGGYRIFWTKIMHFCTQDYCLRFERARKLSVSPAS